MLASIFVLAAASIRATLEPTGKWTVETQDDRCLLRHEFGSDDTALTLVFDPGTGANPTMTVMVRSRDSRARTFRGNGMVAIDDGPRSTGAYASVVLPDRSTRVTRFEVDAAMLAKLPTASTLTLAAEPVQISLSLGRPTRALATLRKCREDLLRSWSLDPAAILSERGPRPISANTASYSTGSLDARDLATGGRAIAVLDITSSGRVENCRIVTTTSADPKFGSIVCAMAPKMKFRPAVDQSGTAVDGLYLMNIRWGGSE